jgi:probable phosphoglycerate mutase
MHLIFIRHGEPDYSVDSLTPEGFREADALAARVARWKGRVTACYRSPLGRAQRTSEPSLAALGMEAETLPWMAEFTIRDHDRPDGSRHCVTWDLLPSWRTEQPKLAEPEGWVRAEPYPASVADEVVPRWEEVKAGVDAVLARHGYVRERGVYRVAPDAATFDSFRRISSAEISGNFTENVPPNPQHVSSSAEGTYDAAFRIRLRGASFTPRPRHRWQLAW